MAPSSRRSSGHSSQLSEPPSDLSRQSSGHSSQQSAPSSYGSTGDDLYQQLSTRTVNCDEAVETQALTCVSFLPRDAIDEVITTAVVKSQSGGFLSRFFWRYPDSAKVAKQAKSLFAILVLCGLQNDFCDLFHDGVRDEHLPLARRNSQGHPNDLFSPTGNKFTAFSKRKNYKFQVDSFLEKQWQVLAPVFTALGEDIHVDKKSPLPFYDIKKISSLNYKNTVYRGTLHAAHRVPKPSKDVKIAIKDYTEKEDFDKEKDNLLKIQDLNHPHLIRHIATIQRGNLFYVIFPWANGGNLAEFWARYPNADRTRSPKIFTWSLQQMLGIVDAMFALHEMNYRHGDLKPENILHFKDSNEPEVRESKLGTLVIADVGVSKLHHLATGLRHDPTDTKATTPCYEAPEAELDDKKPRGRRYDMWSIGCIFMEFAIWLLYGHKAIDNFKHQRKQTKNDPRAHMAAYYTCTGDTVIINPAVSKGLKALENDPRCARGTGLESLINLIEEDLILIDPDQRIKAGKLREKVRTIVQRAERDPGYLTRRIEPPPKIPSPFGEDYG
ncbi:kinase-like protein [Xylaria venustula]|nr:kinase-like protein [Xylaria venustula]